MIKLKTKIKRTVIVVLLVSLSAAAIFSYKFMYGKPFSLNQLYTRTFLKAMLGDPEILTQLGMLNGSFLDFFSDDLTDCTPEHQEKQSEIFRNDLKVLNSYNTAGLSEEGKLSYDIFKWYLQNEADGERFLYYNYPVNQYEGVQNQLPEFMMSSHIINDKKSAKNYVERLSKFDAKFQGLIEGLKLREEKGIIPPRFVLDKVLKESREFISSKPEDQVLVKTFAEKLESIKSLSGGEKRYLIQEAEKQVRDSVYPAYEKLIAYMEKLTEKASADDGVWKLPEGEAYYAYRLRYYTTTNLTPEEIHQIGLSEVARIEKEMKELIVKLGYDNITPGEFMSELSGEQRFKYDNTEAGRQQALEYYKSTIGENEKNLASCFGIKPLSTIEVRPVPEFKEATSPQAYLIPAPSDGSRPGILYVNVGDMKDVTRYNIKALAAHEGIPGHHIQRGVQRELKNAPLFRKAVPFTAFAEGWAMYAEQLAWEQSSGWDVYDNLGRLQTELWRAARLVVDTGIHYKRWTREQGIAYMVKTTGMAEKSMEIEVDRYIVDPGQACAYKIGMMKFIELRERCRQRLGDQFDLKEFHNLVLKDGAMPLDILEQRVDKYILSM